jgi:hypothetical protein
MYCTNCQKMIDDDSKFCIYCGFDFTTEDNTQYTENKKGESDNKLQNNKELELSIALAKEKHFSNYLLDEKNKLKISLSVLLPILCLAVILLTIFLIININNNRKSNGQIITLENQNNTAAVENKKILENNNSLQHDLNIANEKYDSLKKSYDVLKNQNNNKDIEGSSTSNKENITYFTQEEVAFFDKVYNLINEYNLAINHMNVYHGESWVINAPESIALEETFLTKLIELSDSMTSFSYPNSLKTKRDNLVNISKEIYNIRAQEVEFMRNNDFDNYTKYNNIWNNTVQKFRDYYNSIIK